MTFFRWTQRGDGSGERKGTTWDRLSFSLDGDTAALTAFFLPTRQVAERRGEGDGQRGSQRAGTGTALFAHTSGGRDVGRDRAGRGPGRDAGGGTGGGTQLSFRGRDRRGGNVTPGEGGDGVTDYPRCGRGKGGTAPTTTFKFFSLPGGRQLREDRAGRRGGRGGGAGPGTTAHPL
ncbi:hypothetical protein CesoFtcFv8_024988 [Champsocephalus esox]|uniref:Uncharacterized protein n=1 Tax=Champsocephalus esox TaxID=159716 RepID=A0AAN8B3G1_9TELE|nr:hypothetical protein CesoFtcFv8_024988 [Champsocephalus esox]